MKQLFLCAGLLAMLAACNSEHNELNNQSANQEQAANPAEAPFRYEAEQFADLKVLRYKVPGFESLDLKTKTLLYYLYEAALWGRDIHYDQNYKYNLAIRKTLEALLSTPSHDMENPEFRELEIYAKRVWFSNGIHHHYNNDKIIPGCSKEFFVHTLSHLEEKNLPLQNGQNKAQFIQFISDVIFNPEIAPKRVSLDSESDVLQASAVNFYEGVSQKEAEAFYAAMADKTNAQQPMYGLNSKLVKENGKLVEKTWKVGGMYRWAIEKIVYWLEKAVPLAENENQRKALEALITYYKSGDLRDFDLYNIAWVKDTGSVVDVVNGFIEDYHDPLSLKGSYEAVVSIKDLEASKRIAAIGSQAQWFEDQSPILAQHKKKDVKGISAKVINAVVEVGDAGPSSAIGINLPNSDWIRAEHGSKSVNLGNIVDAMEQASGASVVDEFYYNEEIRNRVKQYASLADKLHTDMHEVIGHASGVLEPGVAQPSQSLKNYASALEEGRADLVALYYLLDPKLVELGVMPSLDYGKAAYDEYITKGLLVQLARIKPGFSIEEAHMRNRQFISAWVYEKGKSKSIIEKKVENGKTYFVVNDYQALRGLFGELLREVQRIKSQGDFKAGQQLVEKYGVKIDPALHQEILSRYEKLNIAPYSGFIQPRLVPIMQNGEILDVKIEYPEDFKTQMLEYGKTYAILPAYN